MHSRGQGLSLNTIVIAAVVLIVLIVLIGFFTGYFGKWTGTFQGATDQSCSGELAVKTSCNSNTEQQVFGNFKEVGPGQVCCREHSCTSDSECSETQFCNEGACRSCSSGFFNCDVVPGCESTEACQ